MAPKLWSQLFTSSPSREMSGKFHADRGLGHGGGRGGGQGGNRRGDRGHGRGRDCGGGSGDSGGGRGGDCGGGDGGGGRGGDGGDGGGGDGGGGRGGDGGGGDGGGGRGGDGGREGGRGRGDGRGGGCGGDAGGSDHVTDNFSWQDFSSTQELREEAERREAMKIPTRVAKGSIFTPSESDVHHLLAAISKIERKEKTQVALQRLTPKDEDFEPRSSPTRQRWRLAKVLDSLANLSASKTNHEVIATALRVDHRARSIELIIASNANVPDPTVAHLQKIWETLQQISTLCHPLSPLAETPPQMAEGAQISDLCAKLIQHCLEFSFSRLQKRINKNFHHFSAIKLDNPDPEHLFIPVQENVEVLENIFTRYKGARFGKPPHDETEKWEELWSCLTMTKCAIDQFLDSGGFCGKDIAKAREFLGYESYLRKIVSLVNDIKVLVKLANSPQCKDLLTFGFKVIPVGGSGSEATSVLQSQENWEAVFEKALLFRNKREPFGGDDYVINEKKIKEDTEYMARDTNHTIKQNLVIHCEVRILLYIFKTENKKENADIPKAYIPEGYIPKAYTYIGVSKLSCRGCHAFFESFNLAHGTHFVTKGSHDKSYWPWQFPPSFPKRDKVLSNTYHFIARRWVGSYEGYMVRRVLLSPDSDAQSDSSGDYVPHLSKDPKATVKKLQNLIAKG
jgi:hypothetical protein